MYHNKGYYHTTVMNCWECRSECQEALYHYCLAHGGKHADAKHVSLMTDCIQMCQLAADFMMRNSQLHRNVCDACADVCEACAQSCEQLGGSRMKHCADICWRCAQSCRDMAHPIKHAA